MLIKHIPKNVDDKDEFEITITDRIEFMIGRITPEKIVILGVEVLHGDMTVNNADSVVKFTPSPYFSEDTALIFLQIGDNEVTVYNAIISITNFVDRAENQNPTPQKKLVKSKKRKKRSEKENFKIDDTPEFYKRVFELYPEFEVNADTYWQKIIHNYKVAIFKATKGDFNRAWFDKHFGVHSILIDVVDGKMVVDFDDRFIVSLEKFYPDQRR